MLSRGRGVYSLIAPRVAPSICSVTVEGSRHQETGSIWTGDREAGKGAEFSTWQCFGSASAQLSGPLHRWLDTGTPSFATPRCFGSKFSLGTGQQVAGGGVHCVAAKAASTSAQGCAAVDIDGSCAWPTARFASPGQRHFSVHTAGSDGQEVGEELGAEYLQTSAAIGMREDLKRLAVERNVIPLQELLQICQKMGAASTEEEARAFYKALQRTGVVIGAGKWVYLRPKEVIATVQRYIPHTTEEVSMRIQELERELAPMMEEKKRIECKANKRGRHFLYVTLLGMVAQYLIIFRLTYWELSWDVMEPVAYFAGGGTSVMCLLYYLIFRTSFDYDAVANQWKRQYMNARSFDHEQFESKLRELQSYQRTLRSMRSNA